MGSSGPELILASELARVLGGWNGRPVVFHAHPVENGAPISAASPGLWDAVVGTTFNAAMDGNTLRCEAWINLVDAAEVEGAPGTIAKLEAGEILEVSVSYFAEAEKTGGIYNGSKYVAIQRGFVPDHLAIDIDRGACSVADGCGTRSNCAGCNADCAKRGEPVANADDQKSESIILRALRRLSGVGTRANAEGESFRAVEEAINAALAVANPGAEWVYVRDVFPDEGLVVYDIGGQPFQRSYTIDASGAVTLTGDPIAVVMDVNYTPVGTPPAKEALVASEKRVDELIANTKTKFEAKDRTWLLSCTDEQLDAVTPVEEPEKVETPATPVVETPVAPVANERKLTDAELLAAMSPEMRSSIESGMAIQRERKASLVTALKAHKANPYTDEQLKAHSVVELEALAKLAGLDAPTPDYTGLGGPRAAADESKSPPPPATWAGPKAA
jgi:hypothetical protein